MRRRKRDERTSGVGRIPAAKSEDRSWEVPRGHDLFVDGRLFGSSTPRDLHGHAEETTSAISKRSTGDSSPVGTTRSDRRVRGSVRGVVVTPSSNRHGSKRPATKNHPRARRSESGIVKRLIVRSSANAKAERLASKTHETRVLVVEGSSGKSRFGRILRRAHR
jgi:hypothetical protein